MPGQRVLVVDDEPRYVRLIRFNLEAEGYSVTSSSTGEEALAEIARRVPDLVILDIMLPGIDGLETLRRIREVSTAPVIMLTARGDERDKIRGLRAGADDYVTKPFSAQELVARIQAVLRRWHLSEVPQAGSSLVFDDLKIDVAQQRAAVRDKEIPLSRTEYRLLACLASNAGKVMTHDSLLERIWGPSYRGDQEMLRVTVWRLRQKIEADPQKPRWIVTRPGIGYEFDAPS